MYKVSKYNIKLPIGDVGFSYIYNSKSGAIVKLENKIYESIARRDFSSEEVEPLVADLLRQGIIVHDSKNEVNELLISHRIAAFQINFNVLTIIIAPTMACNYRCVYCFEEGNNTDNSCMSLETCNQVERFISSLIESNQLIKKLKIIWFGGEPLLAFDTVMRPLTSKLQTLCGAKNIYYDSEIVTNGYLLDCRRIEELLGPLNVRGFQITFDGREENYCKFKKPPLGAYERVKGNVFALLQYISEHGIKARVDLRINVTKDNMGDAKLLVEEIKKDKRYVGGIHFYLGRVRGKQCNCDIFELHEFEHFEKEFADFIQKPPHAWSPKKVWCNQYTLNSFCIGPHGELYKCEHDFGNKNREIGSVLRGIDFNDFFVKYITMPIADKCCECILLPLCMGGCPNVRVADSYSCEFSLDKVIADACDYVRSAYSISK